MVIIMAARFGQQWRTSPDCGDKCQTRGCDCRPHPRRPSRI